MKCQEWKHRLVQFAFLSFMFASSVVDEMCESGFKHNFFCGPLCQRGWTILYWMFNLMPHPDLRFCLHVILYVASWMTIL